MMDVVESSKQFRLALLNYNSYLFAVAHATYDLMPQSSLGLSLRIISGGAARDLSYTVCTDVNDGAVTGFAANAARATVRLLKPERGKTRKETVENICKVTISNRKEIETAVQKAIKRTISEEILTSKEKVEILHRLLTDYDETAMKLLKKTILLQLLIICYDLEKLIKVYANLENKEEEKQLMTEFHAFVDTLNITKFYNQIFRHQAANIDSSDTSNNNVNKMLHAHLPSVLVDVILDYTRLSVVDDKNDEEEILRRICSIT